MKYDLSVALGILTRGNTVLISRRMQSDTLGGTWELPGGKKEPGERAFETLRRELKEEIGISVLSARPLISTTRTLEDYHLNL